MRSVFLESDNNLFFIIVDKSTDCVIVRSEQSLCQCCIECIHEVIWSKLDGEELPSTQFITGCVESYLFFALQIIILHSQNVVPLDEYHPIKCWIPEWVWKVGVGVGIGIVENEQKRKEDEMGEKGVWYYFN